MPISYANDISDGQGICIFVRLLFRWKGSLYKLVYIDLIIYVGLYYIINFVYRFALDESHKRTFEEVVKFCDGMKANIPISFLLGFFVAGVISRWWQMYLCIPWLNRIAFLVDGYVGSKDNPEKARKIRLVLMRYMNLAWILLMRKISDQIGIRFRQNNEDTSEETSVRDIFVNFNKDRVIQGTYRKIITDAEIRAFESIAAQNYAKNKEKYNPEYWVPLQWASLVIRKAFANKYVTDPRTCNGLIEEIEGVRDTMQTLQIYSGIMIPLVYTQVVIIAVYSYFLCQLFASQFIDTKMKIPGHEVDFYVPIFTVFQFLFLMGWLKVAMCVMNPFGDDDEDFQTSEILNENLDFTFRTASAGASFFPENLTQESSLDTFVNDIDEDLEEIEPPNVEDDVTALEYKTTRTEKLKSILCCKCDTMEASIPAFHNAKTRVESTLLSSPRATGSKMKHFFRNSKTNELNVEAGDHDENNLMPMT